MRVSKTVIQVANLMLVTLGVYVAFRFHTPATIAVGTLAFLIGLIDAGVVTEEYKTKNK